MICFHFTIFVVLTTTLDAVTEAISCCDLLSFYYLCRTDNNSPSLQFFIQHVVICFHFTIFVVLTTTVGWILAARSWLWFAFILLSLSYWQQHIRRGPIAHSSCDLLSFYYLCRTDNNGHFLFRRSVLVVICFHFTIFVVLTTTGTKKHVITNLLWFAFILLSLSYWQQRRLSRQPTPASCDLLSFYYLCRTDNNNLRHGTTSKTVVICFHFTIFVVLTTTMANNTFKKIELWFAFILLSLSYWQQPAAMRIHSANSCDLLSFYYLCRTDNNLLQFINPFQQVVICFHFTIFVVLTTTESVLFLEFQYVNGKVGTEKMLLLVRCNPVDWRDYIFWLNFRIAPIAARECWRP